jgi:DNA-binding MarR family transcriptional regulator
MADKPRGKPDAAKAPVNNEGAGDPPTIPTERYDLQVLQALRKIMRGVDLYSRKLIGTHDITAPQLICLITIAEEGPLTLGQLADRVFLSSSTVVGILDRLESKGLVLRARDTRDRRLVNVTTTRTGRRLAENAPSPLQESLARALTGLSELEQATIALSLQRIVDLMEVEALDAAPLLDSGTSLNGASASNSGESDEGDEDETLQPEEGVD